MNEISIRKIGQAVGMYVAKKAARQDQTEYLAYGAEIFIGSIFKVSVIFFVASAMDITLEVTVLLIVTGLTRTLSGGAHCTAYYRCLITSVLILIALGYSTKLIYPVIRLLPIAILLGTTVLSQYVCIGAMHRRLLPINLLKAGELN